MLNARTYLKYYNSMEPRYVAYYVKCDPVYGIYLAPQTQQQERAPRIVWALNTLQLRFERSGAHGKHCHW